MVSVPKGSVIIRPIGVVVSDFKECNRTYDYNSESIIHIREDLTEALMGLESFSHLHVIYYQHRRKEWLQLIEGEQDQPPVTIPETNRHSQQGIYCTRSPSRPSALGSCVAEIIKLEGNHIYVKGLDALDGTPVLDIKIYIPRYDAFPEAQIPLNWGSGNTRRTKKGETQ